MSDARHPVTGSRLITSSAAFALCAAILALLMMRAPVAIDIDPGITYRTLLYESVRAGHAWGTQFITTDGPLGALQAPGYLKGSVWMAMVWQIAGNLLLATVLASAVFQLSNSLKWWVLAFLASLVAHVPTLAPWLVMILLGHALIHSRTSTWRKVALLAAVLGFLALSSLSHLLLGWSAVLCVLFTRRSWAAKAAAALSFVFTFFMGWSILGQSFSALAQWIFQALPAVTQTSELLRICDTDPLALWAGFATLILLIILVSQLRNKADRWNFLPSGLFLTGSAWLAWKTISLQAEGLTEFFFSTSLLAGFIFLYHDLSRKWAVTLILIAVGGLIRGNALLITDAVGQTNRQLVASVRVLAALPRLRANLLAEVKAHSAVQAMPRIKAVVGDATVGVIGDSVGRAMLNGLNVRLRPAPLAVMLRLPAWAKMNAAAYRSADAPMFVIQSFRPHGDLIAAFADAPAQLALYQHYELQLEENGLMLWRKKPSDPEAPTLVASGALNFGESLSLPSTGVAYWLELEIPPGIFGHVWKIIGEIPEPGLIVYDTAGAEQRYRLRAALSGAGFLIEPFVRGEVDFINRESGGKVKRLAAISVLPPPHAGWLSANRWHYRLFKLSGVTLANAALAPDTLQNYRLLSRPPVAVSAPFPLNVMAIAQNDFALFAHPPSMLEFALTGSDRRVCCRIGILPEATKGLHPTDGVDFSIEFLGTDGIRQTLYHRWLDPVGKLGDQGQQEVRVDLPRSHGGRLFLRTYNPPGRNDSYDWAFWSYVVIE